ncbi:MAG TPA: TetR/AcrR family transcriptional regulator [Caldilineae bacterium]|nr:TetR/AcrR family transcriptional regulator [Caldilineae bacterium]
MAQERREGKGGSRRAAARARRVERRTAQILDAAARVFARKGFHRATTREIAAEAGVSEGTLYNYFENKQALLIAMWERLAEIESLTRSLGTGDEPPDVFLREVLHQRFDLFRRNVNVIQAVLPELLSQAELRQAFLRRMIQVTKEALLPYIERQIALGRLRSVDPEKVTLILQAFFLGLMVMDLSGEPVITRGDPDLPDQLVEMLIHGLGTGGEAC